MKDTYLKDQVTRVFHRVRERHQFVEIDTPLLFVTDKADSQDGDVEIHSTEDPQIKAVRILNPSRIKVFFDGFRKNALPLTNSTTSKQCECTLFPSHAQQAEWMLFIETKYAADLARAQKPEAAYPLKMVTQIKATVQYFRQKGLIDTDKVVHAIVSFPNLIQEFNSWVFPLVHSDGTEESIMDLLRNDKIIIRATNHAHIWSDQVLLLLD